MEKRYRLLAKEIGADREVPFDGEYTAKEISGVVFIKVTAVESAVELTKALREVKFNDLKFLVTPHDWEYYAVELPEQQMTIETARSMKRELVERGLDASCAKTAAIHFDLTNEQYDQLVPFWDEA